MRRSAWRPVVCRPGSLRIAISAIAAEQKEQTSEAQTPKLYPCLDPAIPTSWRLQADTNRPPSIPIQSAVAMGFPSFFSSASYIPTIRSQDAWIELTGALATCRLVSPATTIHFAPGKFTPISSVVATVEEVPRPRRALNRLCYREQLDLLPEDYPPLFAHRASLARILASGLPPGHPSSILTIPTSTEQRLC